ncbi:glycosyltransferase family 2 protein [Cupriavidus pauculus]|uniref:glycosyltransferase family 2 protein n=1 Tax=Cupriavidus pauculus TaxID=82633 RepID=UPI0012490614|nr:glycosyltransferase family 2 protein [Cupriavidus pauculus]KAB0604837.1 glycosyltransferase family 2 protein [Cupriavidus pauculus]MCM3607109.1 glycosyltransferase family 2 protein [Cupriavidus pauculus]UAL01648.1 glycosyltransferase family 2 protein [Cupriavidus pauculus]
MKISVVLITKNEAHNIRECLESVSWCDRAIIVDSGSTDGTLEIARAMGAEVHETATWPGFGPQKNLALSKATSEWVLSIDADERVTPELRDEILAAIGSGRFDAYDMPRLSRFCGRFMRHSGWYPDRLTRLFRTGKVRFTDDIVHENVIADGPIGHLQTPLLHYTYDDFSQVLRKVDQYSTLGAQQAFRRGKTASVFSAWTHGSWAFLRTWLIRRGFLDGPQGLAVALMNGQASYYKYIKLWLLQQQARQSSSSGDRPVQ